MRLPGLLWQIYLPYLLITLLSLLAVTWYATSSLRYFYEEQAANDLRVRAHLVLEQVVPHVLSDDAESIQRYCKTLGEGAAARVTVIQPDGVVIADSNEDPTKMDNHATRPEVQEALQGRTGKSLRYSNTLKVDMLYFALPMSSSGKVMGVVRTAMPLTQISQGLSLIYRRVTLTGLGVALIAAIISLIISRRITQPLEAIKHGAERFARGDFSTKLPLPPSEELAALTDAMNQMSVQLEDRIRNEVSQRNELEAVFSSMVEGVLAVNLDGHLIGLNRAAAKLLELQYDQVIGEPISKVILNSDLADLVIQSLSSHTPVEGDVILPYLGQSLLRQTALFLQVRGTLLHDAQGSAMGALIVLEDVTRIRRLEDLRRDFVANVSHELRTPITSIKGFVETLLDGALNDSIDGRRFLEIIAKQSDRLIAIINDLLSLSRIEQEEISAHGGVSPPLQFEQTHLCDVLELAIQACYELASARNIALHLACDDNLYIQANPQLIEQAIVNLIDNAIKYSESGKEVHVEAIQTDGHVSIHVQDQGCGIPKEHLPRLFERFYRVDKARSRKLGGTGLGLAIVKHIAQVHGGSVSVESTPGIGSVFTIHFPLS
jgi:two-component system phosphate regulon sensor histidine kinase PhoR